MNQYSYRFSYIGIHITLVHQNNNVAFKRFDMSGWSNEPSGTLSGTMWFQIVVSLKVYRPLYMMGARLSWPVNVEGGLT